MRKYILLFAIIFLVSIGNLSNSQAQSSNTQTSNTWATSKPVGAFKERYKDLNAVGLLVTDYSKLQRLVECHGREEECSKEDFSKSKLEPTLPKSVQWVKEKTEFYKAAYPFYPPSVQFDTLIGKFIRQINGEIVPWLKKDNQSKTSDVAIFKIGENPDAVNNFMKVPGRLLIVVKVNFIALPPPENLNWNWSPQEKFHDVMLKFGTPILVISIEYFRSDGLPFDMENTVLDAKQIVLPLNLGDSYIDEHIKWFIGNIESSPPVIEH